MRTIKGDHFITRYDEDKNVLYGIFGAEATGETTVLLHMAMLRIIREQNISQLYGIQYDLRRVDNFGRDNMVAMQRESFRLNRRHDISQVPVAYVVNTEVQEQIANMVIQMTPDKDRSEIVFSSAEAYGYFKEWHEQHDART